MYKKHKTLGYWVSEDGFLIKQRGLGEKIVFISKFGYAYINYKEKNYLVHRVVYETFYGKIPDGLQINHINGVKSDNRLRNLEVVTASENIRHAVRTGLKPGDPGETNGMAKLDNDNYYQMIVDIMSGLTNDQIAEKYGLHSRYVSLVRGKKRLNTIWDKYESEHGCHPVPRSSGIGSDVFARKLKLLGELSRFNNKELSRRHGVDPSTISRIRSKQSWRDVWEVFDGKEQRL